jgi:hypothetical protein
VGGDDGAIVDVGGDDGAIVAPEPPGEYDDDPRSRCMSLSEGSDDQGIMMLAGWAEEAGEGAERENSEPATSGAGQPGSESATSVSGAGQPETEPMPVCAEHSRSDSSDWSFEPDPESPNFRPAVPSPNVNSRKPQSAEDGGQEGGCVSPMGRIDELGDVEGAHKAKDEEAHQWLVEGAQQAENEEAHLQGAHRTEGQGVHGDDAKDVTEAGPNVEEDVTEAGPNVEEDSNMEGAGDVVGGVQRGEGVGVTEADGEGRALEGEWEGGGDVAQGDDWGGFGQNDGRVGSREGSDGGESVEPVVGGGGESADPVVGGGGDGGLGARDGEDDWGEFEVRGDKAGLEKVEAGGVDDAVGERSGEGGLGGGAEVGGGVGGDDDDDWGDFGGGDFGDGETGFESAAVISGVAVAQGGDDEWGDFGGGGDDGGAFGEFEGAHVGGSTSVMFNQGGDDGDFGDFGDPGAAVTARQSDTAAASTEEAEGQVIGTPNRSIVGTVPDAYGGLLDGGQSLQRAIQSAFGVGVDAVKSPGGRDAAARSPPKDAGGDDDEFGDFEEPCDVVMEGSGGMMGMEGEGCADLCIEWAELMRGSTGGGDYKQWRKSIGQKVPLDPRPQPPQPPNPNQTKARPHKRTRRRRAKRLLSISCPEFQILNPSQAHEATTGRIQPSTLNPNSCTHRRRTRRPLAAFNTKP